MNWHQLKTILWLRWRLTRNQWAKGGGIGAAIAAIVAVGTLLSVDRRLSASASSWASRAATMRSRKSSWSSGSG